MLDQSDPNHIKFIHEFSKKVKSSAKIDAPPGMVASKKKEEFEHGGACPKCSKASTLKPESNKDDSSITSKKSSKMDAQMVATIVGASVGLVAGPLLVTGGLAVAGFGAAGVGAGTLAAGIQSGIGNVVAGSIFASM